jgi:hypothetical protein
MYIAKLTNLSDPDQKYYELLATVPATDIIPPVMLPDAMKDRTSADAAFMDALKSASPAEAMTPEATASS